MASIYEFFALTKLKSMTKQHGPVALSGAIPGNRKRERTVTTICEHEQSGDLQGNGGEGSGEGSEMLMQE